MNIIFLSCFSSELVIKNWQNEKRCEYSTTPNLMDLFYLINDSGKHEKLSNKVKEICLNVLQLKKFEKCATVLGLPSLI